MVAPHSPEEVEMLKDKIANARPEDMVVYRSREEGLRDLGLLEEGETAE